MRGSFEHAALHKSPLPPIGHLFAEGEKGPFHSIIYADKRHFVDLKHQTGNRLIGNRGACCFSSASNPHPSQVFEPSQRDGVFSVV